MKYDGDVDRLLIETLRRLKKHAGVAVQAYDAVDKSKANVIKQEIEAGEIPSPKRMKLDKSYVLITSDECNENTENEKLQTGILM